MSKELLLKYGCNPHQKPSKIFMKNGDNLPITVLNGNPGYINFLDALNAWQLVSELSAATKLPAAASFKHVSPAGAAVGVKLSAELKKAYYVDGIAGIDESPLACAYARARGADRMSSFGDFIALSETCDLTTAQIIFPEISDGVIAPAFSDEALELLKSKRKGGYNILQIDSNYKPAPIEHKDVFGITFEQGRNDKKIDESLLENVVTEGKTLPANAKRDMLIALIALKYTQSNSVCYATDGQVIGVGAGQQSRIHCTRLAGTKADIWWLRQHPSVLGLKFKPDVSRPERDNTIEQFLRDDVDDLEIANWPNVLVEVPTQLTKAEKREWLEKLTDVVLGSDAFFPFRDNIDRAAQSGVKYITEPGGSIRDDIVIEACNEHGITMAFSGLRLFHH
ncbi:MAG: phosphoribosylaminoimidazolecarboxamide formyltransferase [Bacillota bacterium]